MKLVSFFGKHNGHDIHHYVDPARVVRLEETTHSRTKAVTTRIVFGSVDSIQIEMEATDVMKLLWDECSIKSQEG